MPRLDQVRRPAGILKSYALLLNQPLVINPLIFCMMLPHSSDSRRASSAAIFIRRDTHC
jgi:hypothetical protein